MRMLRWMVGIKRIEKIRTEEIRSRPGVANMSEKIREARLGWLERVERKTEEGIVRRTWKTEVNGHRVIARPKLMWRDVPQKGTERRILE